MKNIKTFFTMLYKLNGILRANEKKKALMISFLSIISALFETMSISIILPFVIAMLQPQTLLENAHIKNLAAILNVSTDNQLVLWVGLIVIVTYLVKNAFILWFNGYKLRFRNGLERDLSVMMLKAYTYRPYTFFLKTNSGEMMRGITGDNASVAVVLDSFCTLANEILTCIMIGIMLVIINPLLAIGIIALAGIIALLSVVLLRKRISEYADLARVAFADRYRFAYELIEGIKEISVVKRQNRFLKRFDEASSIAADNNTKYLWIAMFPNRVTEFVFLSGLIILVLISRSLNSDMASLAAQLSAVAVAAIRVLPSISNISNAVNTLVFNRQAFENAYSNIMNERNTEESTTQILSGLNSDHSSDFDSLRVKDVSWRYEEDLPYILKNVNLTVKRGEAIGIIGESGSGKTTFVDVLLGLLKPQNGDVLIDGKSIFLQETGWHKLVGYVPQDVFLIDDSIKNNILFGVDKEEVDENRLLEVINDAQLKDYIDNLPEGMDTILGERGVRMSGGQRQRIAIARALYYRPKLLVLDEATSALDNETEASVIEAITALQGKITMIIVAHRLSTIEKCDRIYRIKNGEAEEVTE